VTGFGPRADGLRLIRIALVAVGVGTVINSVGMVLLFSTIQGERAANIRRACLDTNDRHARTVNELDRLLAVRTRGMTTSERKAVEASRAATVVLIASLAPRRDCDLVVREQVGGAR
jgi:hypothetical protein